MAVIEHYQTELDININGYQDNQIIIDFAYTYHDGLPELHDSPAEPAHVNLLASVWFDIKENNWSPFPFHLFDTIAPSILTEIEERIIEKHQSY